MIFTYFFDDYISPDSKSCNIYQFHLHGYFGRIYPSSECVIPAL